MAVSRLFSMIKGPHSKLIDIGTGTGRMIPFYENTWNAFVLLDNSKKQIGIAQKNITNKDSISEAVLGSVENIPFPDSSFDTALCVRTFHYVTDTTLAIKEIARILKPDGYLVLEIPNKLHFKNRISAMLKKNGRSTFSADPVNIATDSTVVFLNHNPNTISKLLKSNGFKIIEV